MCSCEPESLGRDLSALTDHGFQIEEIIALDMFPQTHHLEAVVWLTR